MSEQQDFLRAISERPDDDDPRLAFADWLLDHGKPLWAELIRAQCSLARLLVPDDTPFRWPASSEVTALVPGLRADLLEPFACLVPHLREPEEEAEAALTRAFSFWVRRGLIEGLEVYGGQAAALFARDAGTITAMVPLRHLRISRWVSRRDALCRSGRMDLPTPRTLRALLDQEFAANLETLDLRELNLAEQGVRCLYRFHHRLNLRRLYFDNNSITAEDAKTLRRLFGAALILDELGGWPRPDDDIPF